MFAQERIFDDPKHQAEYEKIVEDAIAIDKKNQADFRHSVDKARAELDNSYSSTAQEQTTSNSRSEDTGVPWVIVAFIIGIVLGSALCQNLTVFRF